MLLASEVTGLMRAETSELLRDALDRYGSEGAADFFELFGASPARRSSQEGASRQARHARARRQRALAIAGAIALAYEEPDRLGALFDPALGALHGYSAQVHTRMIHLAETQGAFPERQVERVWESSLSRYLELGRRIPVLERNELLAFQLLQVIMAPGFHLVDRGRAREFWRYLVAEARRHGVWENPSCRLWLSISGSHVGEPGPHVDWLLDRRNRAFDLADTLCFVRRDCSESLLDETAAVVRGDTLDPARWHPVIEEAPRSSWLRLGEYVRACSRMSVHCQNEGQVLMVLSWVADIHRHLGAGGTLRHEQARLLRSLRRIDSVQVLEKNRFLDAIAHSSSDTRGQLEALWRLSSDSARDQLAPSP